MHAGDYLRTEIDRYKTILAAWWNKATSGHEERAATPNPGARAAVGPARPWSWLRRRPRWPVFRQCRAGQGNHCPSLLTATGGSVGEMSADCRFQARQPPGMRQAPAV